MRRKTLVLALAALVGVLSANSKAGPGAAYHVGYTHVGYGGVQTLRRDQRIRRALVTGGYHYGGYHYGGASVHYGYAHRW